MPYTEIELIQRVAAKIDEILPPGENLASVTTVESPVKYIEDELQKATDHILRQAPRVQVNQVIKNGLTHFPDSPTSFNGLISVGGTNVVNNQLVSINNVSYKILGKTYGLNPMPITVASDPQAGKNRRDIIVGNDLNELQYITGTPNTNPDLLDFPNTPLGKVLVMKVIILDDGNGGFTKSYIGGQLASNISNTNIRVIPSTTDQAYLVPVPVDFLRFIDIKLSTWFAPVSELIEQSDPRYRKQKTNLFTRGSELKPVAALVSFTDYVASEIVDGYPNQGLAIECFTSKTLPTLDQFHYVPKIKPVNIPEDLLDAMIWECAGRTLLIMNRADRASTAFQQSARYFTNKYGIVGENQ